MKTRSAPTEAPNIAASVKARHHARVLSPSNESLHYSFTNSSGDPTDQSFIPSTVSSLTSSLPLTGQVGSEDSRVASDDKVKTRSDGTPRLLRGTWNPDDRRLFFQAVRLYGRNFTEITKFIRSRGHRTTTDTTSTAVTTTDGTCATGGSGTSSAYQTNCPGVGLTSSTVCAPGQSVSVSLGPSSNPTSTHCGGPSDLNDPCGGRTREQVRFFYQQTWHKVRRYVKFSEDVPQHVREVYAIVNYSVIRMRIKKPLDHRLGERLNELVHCGTTIIRHNGRRFMLRTPVCPALKQINHIKAPTHEFLLPEDVWIELVPASQLDLWRVLEAEQNPRLRLRVDINRQLSDLIQLVETKWQLATERMQAVLGLPAAHTCPLPRLVVRTSPSQTIDGAIRLHEVARIRSGDIALRSYLERRTSADPVTSNMNTAVPLSAESTYTSELSAGSIDSVKGIHDSGAEFNDCPPSSLAVTSPQPSASLPGGGPGTQQSSASTSASELDLRETGRQLSQGVGYEAARSIKVLTLFLALGCPERIRFEYSFATERDSKSHPAGASCHSGFLYYQPADPEGHGISNGLRRLLHLNASDYILHRDWLQSTQHGMKKSNPASQTSTPTGSAPMLLNKTPTCAPTESTGNPTVGVAQSPTGPVRIAPASNVTPPLVSNPIHTASDSSIRTSNVSTAASVSSSPADVTPTVTSNPSAASQALPVPSTPQMPNLVIYTKVAGTKAPLTAVERQLDHRRLSSNSDPSRTCPISPASNLKLPIPRLAPATPRSETTPITAQRKTPVAIVPRVTPVSSSPSGSIQSSLIAMKAYNARRRTSIGGRGGHSYRKPILSSSMLSPSLPSLAPSMPTTNKLPIAKSTIPIPRITIGESNPTTPFSTSTSIAAPGLTITPASTLTNTTSSTSVNPNYSFISMDSSDTSLGPLLDHNGTNHSSVSAFSNDTLASLLNTIYHPSSTTDFVAPPDNTTNDSLGLSNLSTVTVLTDAATVGKSEEFTQRDHQTAISYKREDSVEGGDGNWNDFHYLPKYCPSASTPHLPPESPAFGDISLTDSMAAAVMDTHRGEMDSQDLDPTLLEQSYEQESAAQLDSTAHQTFLNATTVNRILPNSIDLRTVQSTGGYVSNAEAFLRKFVPTTSISHPDPSGTVDLNSLLQSVVSSSTQAPMYESTQPKFVLDPQ